METPHDAIADPDLAYHHETYKSFVRYSTLFVAHVVVILALLAYFLA